MKRFPDNMLKRMRNEIKILFTIKSLDVPYKRSQSRYLFLCPRCEDFNTSLHPKENLARCFKCKINFNPIDLTMEVRKWNFKQAVSYLKSFLD
jgi:DNA primase